MLSGHAFIPIEPFGETPMPATKSRKPRNRATLSVKFPSLRAIQLGTYFGKKSNGDISETCGCLLMQRDRISRAASASGIRLPRVCIYDIAGAELFRKLASVLADNSIENRQEARSILARWVRACGLTIRLDRTLALSRRRPRRRACK